jgi:serine/threonine-protein phosphatase 2A regulatory subunit B
LNNAWRSQQQQQQQAAAAAAAAQATAAAAAAAAQAAAAHSSALGGFAHLLNPGASAASLSARSERVWDFAQSFGDDLYGDDDNDDRVTALSFHPTGRYLAIGDKAGRVSVIRQTPESAAALARTTAQKGRGGATNGTFGGVTGFGGMGMGLNGLNDRPAHVPLLEYSFLLEFESHQPDFDTLRSLEMEPHISALEWLDANTYQHRYGTAGDNGTADRFPQILTANDSTVKLYRIGGRPPETKRSFGAFVTNQHKQQQQHMLRQIPKGITRRSSSSSGRRYSYSRSGSRRRTGNNNGDDELEYYNNTDPAATPVREEVEDDEAVDDEPLDEPPPLVTSKLRTNYSNAHRFNIHSLSANMDGATFLSADELRINVWHLDRPESCLTMADLCDPSLGEHEAHRHQGELITVARFPPAECNVLMYGSSKGVLRLGDMRESPLLDAGMCLELRHTPEASPHSRLRTEDGLEVVQWTDITHSILDARFSPCGRYILARDYLTLRLWDRRHSRAPIHQAAVNPSLGSDAALQRALDKQAIFDKFQCALSNDGLHFLTGSYSNCFSVHNMLSRRSVTLRADDREGGLSVANEYFTYTDGNVGTEPPNFNGTAPPPAAVAAAAAVGDVSSPAGAGAAGGTDGVGGVALPPPPSASSFFRDRPSRRPKFREKMLHCAWHPTLDAVAVAGLYKLFVYQARPFVGPHNSAGGL